jgi:hypothetical protein
MASMCSEREEAVFRQVVDEMLQEAQSKMKAQGVLYWHCHGFNLDDTGDRAKLLGALMAASSFVESERAPEPLMGGDNGVHADDPDEESDRTSASKEGGSDDMGN